MKTFIACLTVTLLALGLAGCNTIRGAGQDIEDAGEVIQDAGS
ncbi:entericidin A/B family lipoprotein [Maricaulis maris]|jgi:predicted small secreted protein